MEWNRHGTILSDLGGASYTVDAGDYELGVTTEPHSEMHPRPWRAYVRPSRTNELGRPELYSEKVWRNGYQQPAIHTSFHRTMEEAQLAAEAALHQLREDCG